MTAGAPTSQLDASLAGWSAGTVMLCADDFAMTEGISRGIAELARIGHISATSAMVTSPHWPSQAAVLAALITQVLPGLHLNLTLGRPLGPMPSLAPAGTLPSIGDLMRAALTRRLDIAEIETEFTRQIEQFSALLGHPPRFVDGHQHVHALPQIRTALFRALAPYRGTVLFVRDPSDRLPAILARRVATPKALLVRLTAQGFAESANAAGFATNLGFAGFSNFDANSAYAMELARCFEGAGPRHLIMCHPGYADRELASLDPVTFRRNDELETLRADAGIAARIWHPPNAAMSLANTKAEG